MPIDQAAVEAYEKHAADLMVYATSLVGPSDAEDVVAEAMLGAFTRARWGSIREPRGYLFRCVLNQARMNERRRSREHRRHVAPTQAISEEPALVDLGMFHSLSLRERAVVYLTYWADLTPAAAAELLGLSEGAVKQYLARARAKLRKELS